MAASSERLEREADDTRAQLQTTLEELRYRITPGQILDQMLDFAGEGVAGEFAGNLRDQVVHRPLALALIGAGLAWLMLPGRGRAAASAPDPRSNPVKTDAPAAGPKRRTDAPVSDAGMLDRAARFCREQPLVVAGAGFAVGALVGAVVGRTKLADAAFANGSGHEDAPDAGELTPVAESLGIVPDERAEHPNAGPGAAFPGGRPDGHR